MKSRRRDGCRDERCRRPFDLPNFLPVRATSERSRVAAGRTASAFQAATSQRGGECRRAAPGRTHRHRQVRCRPLRLGIEGLDLDLHWSALLGFFSLRAQAASAAGVLDSWRIGFDRRNCLDAVFDLDLVLDNGSGIALDRSGIRDASAWRVRPSPQSLDGQPGALRIRGPSPSRTTGRAPTSVRHDFQGFVACARGHPCDRPSSCP